MLPSFGPSRYGRLLNLIWRVLFLRCLLDQVIRRYQVDVIHIRNDGAAVLAASGFERRYGIPSVFQWSFPHPQVYLARIQDGLTHYPAVAKLRADLEQWLYDQAIRSASHVLPVSEWLMYELVEKGVPAEKMTPFPLGFNCEISPNTVDGNAIRQQYNLGAAPAVLYVGEMGRLRRMGFLLRVMKKVLVRLPKTRLLMVGAGDSDSDMDYLKEVASQLGISHRVIFTGFVPRQMIPAYLTACDVAVSPIRPIPLYKFSSPTKLVEAMGMARPVVANDIPEQKKLLTLSGGGICVPYEETAFACGLVWLLEHPEEAKAMGAKGRRFVEKNRSTQVLADLLEEVYFNLLQRIEGKPND